MIKSFLFLALLGTAVVEAKPCDLVLSDLPQEVQILFNEKPNLSIVEPKADLTKFGSIKVPSRYFTDQRRQERTKTVAEAVRNVIESTKVRTLVYLGAGYDSSAGFSIFENAQTVIAVDRNPFLKKVSTVVTPFLPLNSGANYTMWTEVENASSIVEAALFRLLSDIPNFRIRKILLLKEPTAHHGVIQFDKGEGTTLHTYVHIHSLISEDYRRVSRPWWISKFNDINFDGLLIKGSMDIYKELQPDVAPRTVADDIIAQMVKKGGLIVDGDDHDWQWYKNRSLVLSKIVIHQTRVDGFGYDNLKIIEIPAASND